MQPAGVANASDAQTSAPLSRSSVPTSSLPAAGLAQQRRTTQWEGRATLAASRQVLPGQERVLPCCCGMALIPPIPPASRACQTTLLCLNCLQVWGNWEHVSCRGKRVAYDKYEVGGWLGSYRGVVRWGDRSLARGACVPAGSAGGRRDAQPHVSVPLSLPALPCLLPQVPGDGTVTNIHVRMGEGERAHWHQHPRSAFMCNPRLPAIAVPWLAVLKGNLSCRRLLHRSPLTSWPLLLCAGLPGPPLPLHADH